MISLHKLWPLLLVLMTGKQGRGQVTNIDVKISAPSWVARGGSATLRCLHQVPPQLLYKVEFLRPGAKLLQYVRERVPPYSNYTFPGGKLNMSLATENSITIDNLDPTASGLYWCEVSLETPIYTAASPPHQLTVVYSQKHPPIITFGKPDVVVGGLLRANCTSAPAAPAPRLTWYIDNEKVPDESVRYFSYRISSLTRNKGGSSYRHRKHQHRYIAPEFNNTAKYWALVSETTTLAPVKWTKHSKCTLNDQNEDTAKIRGKARGLASPPISLWVSIAEIRTPAHGRIQLTCTATIPDEVGPGERFVDVKKQTVTVAINELSLKRPRSETSYSNGSSTRLHQYQPMLLISCGIVLHELRYSLCRIPECDSSNFNYTVSWWPNHTDQCTKPILNQTYIDIGVCSNSSFTGTTEKCTDWIYENHDTIIFELNLACQPWKKNMLGTVHSIGMALSMLMGGWMADNFGRKPTLLICASGCIIGNFKTLASNYELYIALEFLEAAISGGVYTAGSVLMVEIGGKRNRLLAGVLFSCSIYLGEAVLALIGMAVSNWKILIYIIYSPAILSLSLIYLGIESPRWLIVTGKVSQAKETLKEMARINQINIDEEELKNVDDEKLKSIFNISESVKKEGIVLLFQCKELVIRVVAVFFCRFTASFIYYGLVVNSVMLSGNKNTNFLLAAVMSFPGEFISMILMNKIGRKLPLMIEFILCGISCLAFGYVTETWLKIFLFLLSKFVTSACYTGIIAYNIELFPTSVRGTLLGLCTLSSALGNMLAPLTPALSPAILTQIFGFAAIIASGLLIFTPETKNLPLFDTIEQVIDSVKKSKEKKNNNEED